MVGKVGGPYERHDDPLQGTFVPAFDNDCHRRDPFKSFSTTRLMFGPPVDISMSMRNWLALARGMNGFFVTTAWCVIQ